MKAAINFCSQLFIVTLIVQESHDALPRIHLLTALIWWIS